MGQTVNVVEKPSSNPGVVRFETNRTISGTGHDRFVAGEPIEGNRPSDELARRIFARGGVAAVHINGGVITVDLAKGYDSSGLADVVRGLYTFYAPAPDAIIAEAAVEAAPDDDKAAAAPVLQEIAAAEAAGVPPAPTPGEAVAARNEELLAAAADATAQREAEEGAEPAVADVAGQPEAHGESVADEEDTDEPPAPSEPEVGEP